MGAPAGTPHAQYMLTHVCVAYDHDTRARWVLTHAVRLARRCDARLTIVHVAPAIGDVVDERAELHEELLGVRDDIRCRQRLAGTVAALTSGIVTDVRMFSGRTAPTIVELLRASGSDLVIAGARERRGAARLLAVPVGDALLALAPCPVVLVRSAPPEADPTVLALVRGRPTSDVAWRTARALASDLRAALVDHPAPRHGRDLQGVRAVVGACRRHRPLVTVLAGERSVTTRRRAALSTAETLGEAAPWPLCVLPHRWARERSSPTYRAHQRSSSGVCDGLLSPADRSRATR
jgi:nucleotide-binding universal stress UspA family protein